MIAGIAVSVLASNGQPLLLAAAAVAVVGTEGWESRESAGGL